MDLTTDFNTIRIAASSLQKAQELLTKNRSPQRALKEAIQHRNKYHTDFWKEVVQHLSRNTTESEAPSG